MKISLRDLQTQLPLPATDRWPEGVWDIEAFQNEQISVILFAPKGKDYQTSHAQDELYFVVSGTGELHVEEQVHHFVSGDVLFVAAGDQHHFENFSDDLVTWALFWG